MTPGTVVRVRGFSGVACRVVGPETIPGEHEIECSTCAGCGVEHCDECDGAGYTYDEEPEPTETGRVLVVMVGDDHRHAVDPDACTPIAREDYCGECGQIGCSHDGLDRSE